MSFARPGYAQRTPSALQKDIAASSVTVSFVASAPLGGHRVVRMLAGDLVYADKDSAPDDNMILGITTKAVGAGVSVPVQTMGLMEESSWSWTPDLPIFLSNAGLMTQVAPSTGFIIIVGKAVSATEIYIGIKMPIVLES